MNATGSHADCPVMLREGMAGIEVTISTEPPLVAGPYTTDGFTCPHGVTYWLEPTGEQVARWQAEGATGDGEHCEWCPATGEMQAFNGQWFCDETCRDAYMADWAGAGHA